MVVWREVGEMEVAVHVGYCYYRVHSIKPCLNKARYRHSPSLSPASSSSSVVCASAARERQFDSRPGMGDEEVKREALGILNSTQALPTLFVFDLDYTLWPFYCECRSKRDKPHLYPQAMGILNALKEKEITMAVASRSPTPDIANAFLQKLGLISHFVDMEIFSSWTSKIEHFRNIQQKTGVPFNSMLFFDDENGNIEADCSAGACERNWSAYSLIHTKIRNRLSTSQLEKLVYCRANLKLIRNLKKMGQPKQVSKLGVTCILVHDGVNIEALKKGLRSFANSVRR